MKLLELMFLCYSNAFIWYIYITHVLPINYYIYFRTSRQHIGNTLPYHCHYGDSARMWPQNNKDLTLWICYDMPDLNQNCTSATIMRQNWARVGIMLVQLWPIMAPWSLPPTGIWLVISITQLPLLATSPCLQCIPWPFTEACNSPINNLQVGTTLPHSLLGINAHRMAVPAEKSDTHITWTPSC